ncbi:MAG: hypothetical protein ACM3Q2_16380, partial [Syntrophothermus sp.]
ELVLRKPLKSKTVSFTLPHDCFLSVRVPFEGSLIHNELMEQFRWELSLLYPKISADELAIQYIKLEQPADSASGSALVIATFKKYLKMLHLFCQQNNLQLKFVDNVHLASDNIIALKENRVPDDMYILSIYIADKFISVSAIQKKRPVYFQIHPYANAGEIIPKISAELKSNKYISISPEAVAKAYIAGDNVTDSMIDRLREAFQLDAERINPFEEISIPPEMFGNKFFTDKASSFTAAAGISYRMV